jgi:hypothetical protein
VRSFNGETGAHIAMKTRPERLRARAERPARRRFHHLAGGLGAQRKGQRLADLVPAAGHQQIGERDLGGADPDEPLTVGFGDLGQLDGARAVLGDHSNARIDLLAPGARRAAAGMTVYPWIFVQPGSVK